ncbi:PREDICTED: pre-mRNA-splicing factor CWC25 homolog [Dinoponera quadriceps]|uniref:Pre-mRNA-splicing factor CWC25 homolog n=1 Tax=Dinoponera quadriceps TaxID=609295 RepID=A0A6P3X3I1_DINQU|nr:PREDICTED: pre-mRNA-splicing factor CWC25 homolog [Dinoponera quadriceps]
MGGGDLNLKKSWHPSTMKNMEKVWKAEQQNDQEKRRIAELKREIEMEKDREDMTKYAMEQGVIEKKDEKKLDWMYKGPNQMVNREEYLLGRPVDKAFEQMVQAEKAELNRIPKNHVEYECIPPSLRFFSGNEQVDLARKMQEDPLYTIKKKEVETRNQLLKNPVKLKQLRVLLEQQSGKSKNEKKKKKSKQQDSSDDETKLDMLLVAKYKQLKDNINEEDLLKSMKKKHKQKKKSKRRDYSENDSDNSGGNDVKGKLHKRKKQRRNGSENGDSNNTSDESDTQRGKGEKDRKERDGKDSRSIVNDSRKHIRKRKSSRDRNVAYEKSRGEYRGDYKVDRKRQRYEEQQSSRSKYSDERRLTADRRNDGTAYKWRSRQNLTEEEKERRRQEMISNAMWRDKEREKNVKMYREEEKREAQNNKSYNKDFIRKQLVAATEVGTVASRIKANINNIQRSGRAMDTNFARR